MTVSRTWRILAAAGAAASLAAIPLVARGGQTLGGDSHLAAVGPVDQSPRMSPQAKGSGFPMWYRDADGTTLELCNVKPGPQGDPCALTGMLANPSAPVQFPGNFPDESFYFLGNAGFDVAGPGGVRGRATIVLALEAAFAANHVVDGDQMVFARSRFRIDTPQAGAYTVTWPYGTHTFQSTGGKRGINVTQDVGLTPGAFSGALDGGLGPFLEWAPNPADPLDVPPAGFIGDGATLHTFVGSALTDGDGNPQNYVRIEGPGIREAADTAHACPGRPDDLDCIQSNEMAIIGKIATRHGAEATRATYHVDGGTRTVDVFGSSLPGDRLIVQGSGIRSTEMRADATGRYFARIPLGGGDPPAEVTVRNTTDTPNTRWYAKVTDLVTIVEASYDADTHTLAVRASSSDADTQRTLTVRGVGDMTPGASPGAEQTLTADTLAPPAVVTVSSSAGGSTSVPVAVAGAVLDPVALKAKITAESPVEQIATVDVTGIDSEGDITSWAWSQDPADPYQVAFSGPTDGDSVRFTVPAFDQNGDVPSATEGDIHLRLTITDATTTQTETATIHVNAAAAPEPAIVAAARAPQGALVMLDGTTSAHVGQFLWEQIDANTNLPIADGSPFKVTLSDPAARRPTFTMPTIEQFDAALTDVIRFRLTGTSATGESASTQVDISLWHDDLSVIRGRYVVARNQLRIVGNSPIFGSFANVVKAYRGDTPSPATYLGEADVVPGPPEPGAPQTGLFDLIAEPAVPFSELPVTVTLVSSAGQTLTFQVAVQGDLNPPAATALVARVATVTPLGGGAVRARIAFKARGAKGDTCTLRRGATVLQRKRCAAGGTVFVVRVRRGTVATVQVTGPRQRAVRTAPFRIG